jgi:hypothetical protein
MNICYVSIILATQVHSRLLLLGILVPHPIIGLIVDEVFVGSG